ncbi:MAG: DNA-directed RNA polymerase subunit beta' [Alphaproteobacteria bacterium]|nr:DNA-directed RNA polymerase subunit beta' [Rickettsiales bacterium]
MFDFVDSSYLDLQNISNISMSIASPEDIMSWSCGEIKKSETISYRTYKPENDGLFSARIFGPTRDYECQCGKYKRMKYRGITCEKCGVEITSSRVRRERMGHIELATPLVHSVFLRRTNSPISIILGITVKDLEKIVYFENYIITDPGNTTMMTGTVLTEDGYSQALKEFGDSFTVFSGSEGIRIILEKIDLKSDIADVNKLLSQTKAEAKIRSLLRRLKLLEDFVRSKNRPEWMVLTRLPVLPPDLRPLVQLDGGRFVSSDLNELYRRVINRNDRLRRMLNAKAPQIIVKNEKRMLQEAVDALFDNSRKTVTAKSATGRPLKSLSEYLKGKQGRFRQNLLGKRVDYSGRSVIVVGPSLRLNECGLPKIMALELFKPFILSKLIMYGKVSSVRNAKKIVDQQAPEVWEILEEVIQGHLVLLNRAPTLHRLNIQAFQPKLIEAKAIQLHPLVCKAFNADFDGDQMAVHIPLSIEAQTEAFVLMMSSNNVLSPQNGDPIIVPTKDIVVGLYYMTAPVKKSEHIRSFDNYNSMIIALDAGVVSINSPIKYYYKDIASGNEMCAETTVGRMMVYKCLPQDEKMSFEEINVTISSKNIGNILRRVYTAYGQDVTVNFSDEVKDLGFTYSTKAGISFGKDDMIVPETKQKHINNTLEKIKVAEQQYADGYITFREKYNQVTDRWSECTDRVASDMMAEVVKTKEHNGGSSIYIMMLSGARVSEPVMRQIAGMRGLIAKPSGEIIEAPIMSNFKEGMTVLEYFNSAHGARKGAADTALKTADAGYLTRRLVDVSQDCVVTEYDCGADSGITYSSESNDKTSPKLISKVIFGRVLASDVEDSSGNILLSKGTIVDHSNGHILDEKGIKKACVRSLVKCKAKGGVCSLCYGKDLSTDALVSIGEAVGIIAAQSIGEPGAQLTMRTFHIGGVASRLVERSEIISSADGIVSLSRCEFVKNRDGDKIVISYGASITITDTDGRVVFTDSIPYAAKLLVEDRDSIKSGGIIAQWDPYNTYIIAENDGAVRLSDFVVNVSYNERVDEATNVSNRIITDWTSVDKSLNPSIVICDTADNPIIGRHGIGVLKYILPIDAIVPIDHGDIVRKGDVLARVPHESTQVVRDITGGLPRVEDIFEARVPKNPAVIAEIDGVIEFVNDYKTRNRMIIRARDGSGCDAAYNIPRGKHIRIQEGSLVKKGDVIVDGKLDPHDVLAVGGVDAVTEYIVDEVQKVYKLQGVEINNKHIEIIVRYMLRKVEIIDRGSLPVVHTQQCDLGDIEELNDTAVRADREPAVWKRVLQGITRASLKTSSFISAASFQETSRVLMDAAIAGARDDLRGMKENVIVGRLVPAGTGYVVAKMMEKSTAVRLRCKSEDDLSSDLQIFDTAFDFGSDSDSDDDKNKDSSNNDNSDEVASLVS